MFKSTSNLIALVLLTTLISCTESTDTSIMAEPRFDLGDTTYFNEFVGCETASEYSPELMNEMIFEWQGLLDSNALVGGWIYLSASNANSYPDGAWWELQWDSYETAKES